MSSLGPLGPPPTAPIVNPVMWAPELPSNRPQNANAEALPSTAHRPGARPIAVGPLRGSIGAAATPGEPGAALSASPGSDLHPGAVTPLEVERRGAAVQRSLHPSHHHRPMHAHVGGAGAWLEPHDIEEPLTAPAAQPAASPAAAAAKSAQHAGPHGVTVGRSEEQEATDGGGGAKTVSAAAGGAGGAGAGVGDSVDGLGDGSVAEAMEVLEQVRGQGRGQGSMEEKA